MDDLWLVCLEQSWSLFGFWEQWWSMIGFWENWWSVIGFWEQWLSVIGFWEKKVIHDWILGRMVIHDWILGRMVSCDWSVWNNSDVWLVCLEQWWTVIGFWEKWWSLIDLSGIMVIHDWILVTTVISDWILIIIVIRDGPVWNNGDPCLDFGNNGEPWLFCLKQWCSVIGHLV